MDGLKKFYDQLVAQWAKLSARARTGLVAIGIVGLLAAIAISVLGRQPKRTLFSGLDPSDAAAVVGVLESAKIDYELGAGGSIVKVPASDVDRARLMMAEQDLPKTGNVGFEMFEEQSFGLTDFAQQVNYRRALQGELERTIAEIDAVAGARVHVTQPRRAVFEDEKIPPTASVTLRLVQGRKLGERSVGAIRHLVASAVEGLEPGEVTVVDTKGNLLSRAGLGHEQATAALDYESDLERELERKLTRLLERTVGVGGAEVRVAAEIDFSRTDTTEEVYDPEQIAIRNESTQEIFEGEAAGRPGGVAGAQANSPGGPEAGTRPGAGESSRVTRSKNYEVNRTVVRTVGPGATLKRLTVAVLVDGTYTTPEDGSEPVFNALADEDLGQLQGIVENAIGFNATRGDRIKISSVPFRDRPDRPGLSPERSEGLPAWVPYAIGGGGLLVIGVAFWLIRRRTRAAALNGELLSLPATVSQAQAALDGTSEALPEGARAALAEAAPSRDDIQRIALEDPERAADIIRAWMSPDIAS